jgi:hypothetical protein
MQAQKLSDLQLDLLNVCSFQSNKQDIIAIRQFLAGYFSDKLKKNIQQSIEEKNITSEDLDRWINE